MGLWPAAGPGGEDELTGGTGRIASGEHCSRSGHLVCWTMRGGDRAADADLQRDFKHGSWLLRCTW